MDKNKAEKKINWRINKVKEHCSEINQLAQVHMQVMLTDYWHCIAGDFVPKKKIISTQLNTLNYVTAT